MSGPSVIGWHSLLHRREERYHTCQQVVSAGCQCRSVDGSAVLVQPRLYLQNCDVALIGDGRPEACLGFSLVILLWVVGLTAAHCDRSAVGRGRGGCR